MALPGDPRTSMVVAPAGMLYATEPDRLLLFSERSVMLVRVLRRPLALALVGLAMGLAAGFVAITVVEWLAPDASDLMRIAVGYVVSVTVAFTAIAVIARFGRSGGG